MKFRNFLDVSRTSQQAYFKDGAELLYPDQNHPLHVAILPAYDPKNPDPTSWIPAVVGEEESDFYTTIRAAKFVGHGNRRAKTAFLSPRTFDLNSDDPYEAFYEYCSRSDKWSYLTKDKRGKRLTGEVEGAIFPRMKNFFVANIMDVSAGSRSGVFVTELSESVAKNLLYSIRKNGSRVDGLAFQRDDKGQLIYGDITNPDNALVLEIAWSGKGYVARPLEDRDGNIVRTEIPKTLLQHRKHMDEPGTFIVKPESGQEVVDRLAGLLRGYKSEDGEDEINALKEAIKFTYGKSKYVVQEEPSIAQAKVIDPFANAAENLVTANQDKKVEVVDEAIEHGVEAEHYTPVNKPVDENKVESIIPGEGVDLSDIVAVREMLAGKKNKK